MQRATNSPTFSFEVMPTADGRESNDADFMYRNLTTESEMFCGAWKF
jgi:hypothetical protein